MDPKLEGGNWGKHLDLVSLKPVSALCAENRIDKAILKICLLCWRLVTQISNTIEDVNGVPMYCSEQPVCFTILKWEKLAKYVSIHLNLYLT